MSDSISRLLTPIRNALKAKHEQVDVPFSAIGENIARILQQEGYIWTSTIAAVDSHNILRITLKYDQEKKSAIERIVQVSSPGRRMYVQKEEVPRVKNGLGIAILSTSKGLLTDRKAREIGVGGEVICYIW